jgi:hypothetical protein
MCKNKGKFIVFEKLDNDCNLLYNDIIRTIKNNFYNNE